MKHIKLFEVAFPTDPTDSNVDSVSTDKQNLIEVLTNHLNYAKNSEEFSAMDVAMTIYNDCAHFMNKTDMFASRQGSPLKTKAATILPTED